MIWRRGKRGLKKKKREKNNLGRKRGKNKAGRKKMVKNNKMTMAREMRMKIKMKVNKIIRMMTMDIIYNLN